MNLEIRQQARNSCHLIVRSLDIQSNSSMHRYECVALCKNISLQRVRFCARSLAS